MPKITNEDNIKEKLEYIGLDLESIPNFLKEYKDIDYRPLKAYDENTYKVYKYVKISEIQILLTPKNRLNTIKEKYGNANRLYKYLVPENEEDIVKHTVFLKMLKETRIEKIQEIEEEQKKLNNEIPYKIRYKENYSWQIYYSDTADVYFMIVPTEDLEYATFFYLLKKQIEYHKTKKEEMIFVPICYENYSEKYLKKSEISDIEQYLWFFTKNLPNVYEVYDKKGDLTLYIVGDTIVYDGITSSYRNKFKTKEEAVKFHKLLKALFILGTELSHHYKFIAKINRYGSIEFEYKRKKINYDNMFDVLNDEYINAKKAIIKLSAERLELEKELEKQKKISANKDEEYLRKEKQIATYLECRRTFFGRVKYFFTAKKMKKKQVVELSENEIQEEESNIQQEERKFVNKEYYTIADIVSIYKELDELEDKVKNLRLDTQALINKIRSIEIKIENANLYITEIDKHEKNIFEFWKFTNKDENKLLNQGTGEIVNVKTKIEKVYNYKEDMETIGNIIDKEQRNKFSKEELDAIYLLTTNVFDAASNITHNDILNESLEKIKQEAEEERILFNTEKLDIFGNISENTNKAEILGTKKHRETKKDKLKILDINKDTTVKEYKSKLSNILQVVREGMEKVDFKIALPVYMVSNDKIRLQGLHMCFIDPYEAIEQYKDEKEIILYKINLKENSKVIYFSNSVYYDNYNQTLPIGMDKGTRGIIDLKRYNFSRVIRNDFRVNELINEFETSMQKINTYEYGILEEEDDK